MKKSKLILLSLGMAVCAAGGAGAAYAAITKQQATSSSTASYDKAIYLYWDSESSSSASLSDMTTLETNVPQYRYLAVSPKSSKSVAGTVTLTFTLSTVADADKTAVMKGLKVTVYQISEAATSETLATLAAAGTQKCELDTTSAADPAVTSGTATFTVSADSAVHETVAHYAIKVVYDGSVSSADEKLSAQLNIHQTFAA